MDSNSFLFHLFSLLIKSISQTSYTRNCIHDFPTTLQGNQNKKYLVKGNLYYFTVTWKIGSLVFPI